MATYERTLTHDFDTVLSAIDTAILHGSSSAKLEGGSDHPPVTSGAQSVSTSATA